MEFRFSGSGMPKGLLVRDGFKVGRLHVATLMKRMGIEALYHRTNTSKPAPGHKIYPYLHRKLPITPLCQGICPLHYFSSISQVGGIGR
jgi:putative transposase